MTMAELPEDTQLVYSNWARLDGTLVDLALDFGYSEEPFMGPPKSFPVRVVMTWEAAKGLHELLGSNLEVYEENIGQVRTFETEEVSGDDD
jgi:hypothetical protein